MIESILTVAVSLFIPLLTGYSILLFLDKEHAMEMPIKIALSYGLGLGLLSIWMLCLGIFNQPFGPITIGLPLILVSCTFLVFCFNRHSVSLKPKTSTTQILKNHWIIKLLYYVIYIVLLTYIASNIIYVFWRALTIPVFTFDSFSTIAFKAKIFYFEKSLPSLHLLPHKTYPLFVPFVQSWVAFNLGRWDDILINVIFPCALLSYLTIHYKFLAHFTNKTWAVLGCAFLLSSTHIISN